jgi:arylsulfatase A-like enzyme
MAAEYLEEAVKKSDPWCCVVSVEEPHDPFICSEDAYVLYGPQTLTLPPNGADSLADKPGIYRKAARIWQEFTDKEKKEAMACYYASITEIDAQFGKLLRLVEESACADNTIIIFTTDHGEFLVPTACIAKTSVRLKRSTMCR